jgi:hypothetical protein
MLIADLPGRAGRSMYEAGQPLVCREHVRRAQLLQGGLGDAGVALARSERIEVVNAALPSEELPLALCNAVGESQSKVTN